LLLLCPGITTWLPWAAQLLTRDVATPSFNVLRDRPFLVHAVNAVLGKWIMLMERLDPANSSLAESWLAPTLLQLAHAVMSEAPGKLSPRLHPLLKACLYTQRCHFTLPAHPQLHSLMTGSPGDVTLGATVTVAEAARQVRAPRVPGVGLCTC
jgi:hypothetical protein